MKQDFTSAARAHWARYPLMEPQDFCKLAYQSEFGPAHMVESPDKTLAALLTERKEAGTEPMPPEPIGNGLCRVPITQALSTLSDLPLIGRMFSLTMAVTEGTPEGLADKLAQLEALPVPGMADYLDAYRRQGCPPVSHSEAYRNAYSPHYRVVRTDYAGYLPALRVLDRFAREHYAAWLRLSHRGDLRSSAAMRQKGLRPCLIAVDGRCGSGKTGFADIVDHLIPGSRHVIHMDDFYLPWEARAEDWKEHPAGNMDLDRLREQVLAPVSEGRPLAYPPILQAAAEKSVDLDGEPIEVDPDDVEMILVEGTYSQHPALAGYYDWKLFLTCEHEEQTRRLQAREGDYYPTFDSLWRALEERYFAACATEAGADLTIDTTNFF